MSDHEHEHEPEAPPLVTDLASGELPKEGSLLDALVQARDEIASSTETYLMVPGYQKSGFPLFVKYALISGDDIARVGRKVQQEFPRNKVYERNLYSLVDMMIEACRGIYVEVDGNKQPLTVDGVAIAGFNEDLASALQLDVNGNQPARSTVIGLFVNNITALLTHGFLLQRWMGDTTVDVNKEFYEEGNLLGTT